MGEVVEGMEGYVEREGNLTWGVNTQYSTQITYYRVIHLKPI